MLRGNNLESLSDKLIYLTQLQSLNCDSNSLFTAPVLVLYSKTLYSSVPLSLILLLNLVFVVSCRCVVLALPSSCLRLCLRLPLSLGLSLGIRLSRSLSLSPVVS